MAVVGGAGFLGSHVVEHLIEDRQCQVLVIDNLVAGRREFVHPKATFQHADITESEEYLRQLFEQHQVEYALNYAAWPYIVDSFSRPLHVFNVNATGALKVINAAQAAECKGILQISSAEIYGNGQRNSNPYPKGSPQATDGNHPDWFTTIDEDAQVIPHSSYGAAKAAIDAMVQVRWREAKTPCIALRQFNCIGERETHPYVVPEIVSQLDRQRVFMTHHAATGKNPFRPRSDVGTVRLGNNSFRDFLYAGDQARMAVELLEKGEFGEVYNLGSETGIKIYDLAKLIGKIMGFAGVVVEPDPARVRPWEIWHLQSDNSKIYGVIEARPQVDLEEALRRTIKSFEDNGRRWGWEAHGSA
ncbi:MAG TPA: NAD-dependent epimerase/dehydratase family protein [Aquabacterium sp.]|nr:NAD-dependent epimerase/dehydratase family protein [Aquabacterium sp.]